MKFLFTHYSDYAIYCILNLINGKVYIGSAVNVQSRIRTHKSRLNLNKHPNKHLQAAYNEYGELAFEFLIVEHVLWKSDLTEREQYWIDLTQCYNTEYGYNLRTNATSNLGLKLGPASEARKQRMSDVLKGRTRTADQIEASRKFLTGKKLSIEHITNAVNGRKGYRHSEETKNKMRIAKVDKSKWPHGYKCNCRECLDKKNLIRNLKRYNHEGEFQL